MNSRDYDCVHIGGYSIGCQCGLPGRTEQGKEMAALKNKSSTYDMLTCAGWAHYDNHTCTRVCKEGGEPVSTPARPAQTLLSAVSWSCQAARSPTLAAAGRAMRQVPGTRLPEAPMWVRAASGPRRQSCLRMSCSRGNGGGGTNQLVVLNAYNTYWISEYTSPTGTGVFIEELKCMAEKPSHIALGFCFFF